MENKIIDTQDDSVGFVKVTELWDIYDKNRIRGQLTKRNIKHIKRNMAAASL